MRVENREFRCYHLAVLARLFILSFALTAAAEEPALDEATTRRLAEALSSVNLSLDDLGWDKRPIDDPFRLSCVNETLDRPLTLADRALRAEREFADDPIASAKAAAAWLDLPPPSIQEQAAATLPEWEGVPAEALEALRRLLSAWRTAETLREAALAPLSAEALDALPTVPVLGRQARMVEIDGGKLGMFGLVCDLGTQTVFVKMTGPTESLRAERERFVAFCKSLS